MVLGVNTRLVFTWMRRSRVRISAKAIYEIFSSSNSKGIESQSFSLLIASFSFIRLFVIIRPINTFHGPTTYNSMRWKRRRHARRDEEERPAGGSGIGCKKGVLSIRFKVGAI